MTRSRMGTLARRRGRDVKGVHTATQALVLGGVIDKTAAGKLLFPYDAVRVQPFYGSLARTAAGTIEPANRDTQANLCE